MTRLLNAIVGVAVYCVMGLVGCGAVVAYAAVLALVMEACER